MALTGGVLLVLLVSSSSILLVLAVLSRRRRARIGWACCFVVALALAFGAVENDQFGYDRSWADVFGVQQQTDLLAGVHVHLAPLAAEQSLAWPTLAARARRAGHGVLLAVDFSGGRSRLDRSGYVYLPARYFEPAGTSARFPVVELISGSPGAPANWLRQLDVATTLDGLIQQHRMQPVIAVIPAPNGHLAQSQECVDAVGGAQDDTYLTQDVRTDVLAAFRAEPVRTGWALAGYSTGGFCAVNLLLRHSDEYAAAASMDGYFHALDDHYTGDLYRGDRQLRLDNSPDWMWSHRPPTPHVAMLLMAGGDDQSATTSAVAFHDEVATSPSAIRGGDGVQLVLDAHAGHSFTAWRHDLPALLQWVSAQVARP